MQFLLILTILLFSFDRSTSQTPKKTEVVSVNGTSIYYEVYGKGKPLFLLHAITLSSKYWLPYVSDYSNDFEVYLVDLTGHGKSSPFKEKFSIQSTARDLNGLIKYLKLDSINAIGYSSGADVLFQLTLLNPRLVKSIISIGACGSWNAKDYPDFLDHFSYKNIDKLQWMREFQTSETQIRSILDQLPNYNVSVSDEEMNSIKAKTMFVFGDQEDVVLLECSSRARKNLPNSFLWILPNTNHGAHEGKNKNEFVRLSKEFFKESWSK